MANGLTFLGHILKSIHLKSCYDYLKSSRPLRKGIFLSTQYPCQCSSELEVVSRKLPNILFFLKKDNNYIILPWVVLVQSDLDSPIPSIKCTFLDSKDLDLPQTEDISQIENYYESLGSVLTICSKINDNSEDMKLTIKSLFYFFGKQFSHFYLYIPNELEKFWQLSYLFETLEFYSEAVAPIHYGSFIKLHYIKSYTCYRNDFENKAFSKFDNDGNCF